ncbi:hypothetical protein OGAPHI_001804 [Ogataea philodendri]|uniref:Exosome complex protein n=1 Tax=Ogataea philodendri TaxID=1378263 RepID=A0A9P8PAL3_9ASCO|nr:uncharacterized protein OGAPHI_001804 [Ogataea philodendri]KAH3668050.1 hypothetical protein OGAPHI_001804 [Ogataea philodendri]
MDETESVKKLLASLSRGIDDLEKNVKSEVFIRSLLEHVQEAKSPLEKVDLYNNYAYVIASLYFVLLKTSGENKKNEHPIMQELNRVKLYIDRAKKAEQIKKNGNIDPDEASKAAERYVKNQLGEKVEPAVSKVHFEGRHTKFDTSEENDKDSERPAKRHKPDSKKSRSKTKKSKDHSLAK